MATPYEAVKNFSTWLYKKYKNDPAKMLIHTGAIGWTLSAFAQIGAVLINDDIPKEQKKFLIPQEMADAAINIATFYLFTNTCNEVTKKLIQSGKLSSKHIKEFVETNISKDEIGKFTTNIEKSPNFNQIEDKYKDFSSGVGIVVNLVASVVASNILTPILRNNIGARVQKYLVGETKADREKIQQNPLVPAPLNLPAQNRFGMDDYRKKIMNSPRVISSGSMRV